jgi:hypothetical protein
VFDSKNYWRRLFISESWHRFSLLGRDQLRYVTPRYFRYIGQTVVVTPLIMGFASAYLFATVPQMQEVYLGLIEKWDLARGLGGLAVISLFSALLYSWNHTMVTGRIDAIYPDHADIYFDRGVINVRDLKTVFASSLPFLGLIVGLLDAGWNVEQARPQVEKVSEQLTAGLPLGNTLLDQLKSLPPAIHVSIALTIVIYLGFIAALHRSRNKVNFHQRLLYFCYGLSFLGIGVPIVASNTTILAARFFGPLIGTALVLIAGAVLMRFLFLALQFAVRIILTLPSAFMMTTDWIPLPLRTLVVVLVPLIAVGFIGVKTVERGKGDKAATTSMLDLLAEQQKGNNALKDSFVKQFNEWLDARKGNTTGKYPVFIVTAEGGGIYAASAASYFLATMQDHCPAFAKHVFAISAVSGGSVGASLFDAALSENKTAGGEPSCDKFTGGENLAGRLRKVTQEDHLSPVLAYLLPDFIRGITGGGTARKEPCRDEALFNWFPRDQILEKSFIYSFERSRAPDGGADYTICQGQAGKNMLMRQFPATWQNDGDAPALLLNTTWVETGYRVAFSPFPLRQFGKGTLYSFADLGRPETPSLIESAVISARFPIVMPPWISNLRGENRWSFVDGGYADASGATTGLELFNELKSVGGDRIDPHLVVLTDAFVEPDFKKISASWFDGFISPFNTILTVRELLARRAVTQAYDQLKDELVILQLDQKTFPLPLGWKISELSSAIIRFTMGWPTLCDKKHDHKNDWAVRTVNDNSCQLERIRALLSKAP